MTKVEKQIKNTEKNVSHFTRGILTGYIIDNTNSHLIMVLSMPTEGLCGKVYDAGDEIRLDHTLVQCIYSRIN